MDAADCKIILSAHPLRQQRLYIVHICDASNVKILTIVGPLLHPWTFNIIHETGDVGVITKKWSGLGKEVFTDADNFGITFSSELKETTKAILLGAVFLIDFLYFENRKRRS